jgi:voltage-gated potassium channel
VTPLAAEISLRRRVFDVIEGVGSRTVLSTIFSGSLIVLIVVNVIAAVLETVPSVANPHRALFNLIENFSLLVFGIEYVVRLWVCVEQPRYRETKPWRARLAYAVTPAAIIDLIAIAPFLLGLFLEHVDLRTLVLLRLLRLFKLGRYSTGFQSLVEAVRRERQALLASFLVLFSVVLIAASLAYLAEREAQPEAFGSIPAAVWWALETVTTVGYGDVTPKTLPGRIIGGLTMVTGILMIALPVAIIGSSFTEVVRQRSFVVTFGLIARMQIFSGLPAEALSDLLAVLKAMTIESGTPIIPAGSDDDALYIVAAGIVELDDRGTRRRLDAGETFGTGPEYDAPGSRLPALSMTRVKLLILDRMDLLNIVARYPDLAIRLRSGIGTPEGNAPVGAT